MTATRLGQLGRDVGDRIRTVRHSSGWSQGKLAYALGLSQAAVCRWEQGSRVPSAADLILVAEALGADPGELLPGADKIRPYPAARVSHRLRSLIDELEDLTAHVEGNHDSTSLP